MDIFIVSSGGGKPRRLRSPAGPKSALSFSPDGLHISYLGHEGFNQNWKNSSLWTVSLSGRRPARNLTSKYDIDVTHKTISDIAMPSTVPPIWSPDGRKIYFQVTATGNTLLCSVDIHGRILSELISGPGVVHSFDVSRKNSMIAFIKGDMKSPGDLWVKEMDSGKSILLVEPNRHLRSSIDLAETETLCTGGKSRPPLQGWIVKPPYVHTKTKHSAILLIHGGPRTQFGNSFMFESFLLAASGYAVYFCNPSGSKGYGEEHAKANTDSWGNQDYRDIIRWDNFVTQKSYIDKRRRGIMGHSYGGYMTNWMISHSTRFRAAVSCNGISNLISFWGSGDYNWWLQEDFGDVSPLEDFKKYWDRSPLKYAGKVKTPTLIIHGGRDMRSPIEQSEQWYVSLKKAGVQTKMIIFPEATHFFTNVRDYLKRIELSINWFDRFLI
jgi:dipeptidyl aminopeptidase/acylaminoacyl peptidase